MKSVVLLRTDGPAHLYLEDVLMRSGMLRGVVVETAVSQRRRLWNRGMYRRWGWRVYQDTRHTVAGRASYAREFFIDKPLMRCTNVVDVDSVNSSSARAFVADVAADVAVVCGTSVLDRRMLDVLPTAINVHGGVLPHYRGNHGIFFAFSRGDFHQIGASLHLVVQRLDHGPILAVARPSMRPGMHDGHLVCVATRDVIDELPAVLRCPSLSGRPQPDRGDTFRHQDRTPLIEFTTWLRRRTGRLAVPTAAPSVERWYE